jgi:acyl carrier protein
MFSECSAGGGHAMDRNIEYEIIESIRETCAAEMPNISLTRESKLADLGIDSMKIIEIAYRLEKRFGIEVQETMLLQLRDINSVIAMVRSALEPKAAESAK